MKEHEIIFFIHSTAETPFLFRPETPFPFWKSPAGSFATISSNAAVIFTYYSQQRKNNNTCTTVCK